MFKRPMILLIGLFAAVGISPVVAETNKINVSAQSVQWFDGQRYRTAWLSEDEMVEFKPAEDSATFQTRLQRAGVNAQPVVQIPGVRIWRVPSSGQAVKRSELNRQGLSSILYRSAKGGPRMALNGELVLKLAHAWPEAELISWLAQQDVDYVRGIDVEKRLYLIKVAPGIASLQRAEALMAQPEVESVTPNWWREVGRR